MYGCYGSEKRIWARARDGPLLRLGQKCGLDSETYFSGMVLAGVGYYNGLAVPLRKEAWCLLHYGQGSAR